MGRRDIEKAREHHRIEAQRWWEYAVGCAQALRSGAPAPAVEVHGIVLQPSESVIVQGTAEYSRRWGGDGTYYRDNSVTYGPAAFSLAANAMTMIGNGTRRRAAERNAVVQWREQQQSPFMVTTHRVLCHTQQRGWLSFWFGGVTEFHPDLDTWSVVFGFGDTQPLRLAGAPVPALALWCAKGILGDRWQSDPRLQRLMQ